MNSPPSSASQRVRKRPRLATAVVEDLVNAIVTEIYPPGSALPPENMLGEIYAVSRTVVREATMALTEKGLVVSQQGRGTIVLDASAWDMLDPMIRSLLEGAMAAKAARNATPEQIAELTAQVEKLEGLISVPAAYVHEDVAFHDIIMRMSGDRLSKAICSGVALRAAFAAIAPSSRERISDRLSR
jgi:DNA-binding FadR family transcriptional regulator